MKVKIQDMSVQMSTIVLQEITEQIFKDAQVIYLVSCE